MHINSNTTALPHAGSALRWTPRRLHAAPRVVYALFFQETFAHRDAGADQEDEEDGA